MTKQIQAKIDQKKLKGKEKVTISGEGHGGALL
jgi:hypothetical protein